MPKTKLVWKNEPGEKAWTKLAETFAENWKPVLKAWLDQKKRKPEKTDFAKWNRLPAKTLTENHEADFRDLSQFEMKLFEPKTWANFQADKIWKITTAKRLDLNKTENLLKPETWFWRLKLNLNETQFWKKTQRFFPTGHTNGLRYLRWGEDGEAVQPEKWQGV